MRDYTWLKTTGELNYIEKQRCYQVDIWVHEDKLMKNRFNIDEHDLKRVTNYFRNMDALNESDDFWDEEYENSDVIQSAPANNNKYMYLLIKY